MEMCPPRIDAQKNIQHWRGEFLLLFLKIWYQEKIARTFREAIRGCTRGFLAQEGPAMDNPGSFLFL